MPTVTITTPRPPLNLFEIVRIPLAADAWTTVYQVPQYSVPADGPTADYTVDAAAIVSNLILTSTTGSGITADVQVIDAGSTPRMLTAGVSIAANSHVVLALDKHILLTDEILQVRLSAGASGLAHFSFVLNQRERYTVIAP